MSTIGTALVVGCWKWPAIIMRDDNDDDDDSCVDSRFGGCVARE